MKNNKAAMTMFNRVNSQQFMGKGAQNQKLFSEEEDEGMARTVVNFRQNTAFGIRSGAFKVN